MDRINQEICSSSVKETPDAAILLPEIVATDGELLLRFTKGEQAAFAELVERHRRVVWLACWQVLRHREDVEDTFQATFLILARKASSLRSVGSLAAWLHRVAYRAAIRLLRNKRKHSATQLSSEVEMAEDKLIQIQRREESSILLEELRSLPDKYQVPLILCHLEGRSRSAAAEEIGCTTATVKGRLARGRSMLRVRLARRGVGLSVAMAALATPLRQAEASLSGSLMAELVLSCQATHLGQPIPDELSTQALNLSQQTFIQEGLLSMTTASLAKPICLGVALLGLATAAVADVVSETKGSANVVASSNPSFELAAVAEEATDPVDIEIASTPVATVKASKKPAPNVSVKLPVDLELPELAEQIELEAIVEPVAVAVSRPQPVQAPLATPVIKTVVVERLNAESVKASRMIALRNRKKSLELKSKGLEFQAEARAHRAKALETEGEQERDELLRKADILELNAEANLLRAESSSANAEIHEINRQIEALSKEPLAAIPPIPATQAAAPTANVRRAARATSQTPANKRLPVRLTHELRSEEDLLQERLAEQRLQLKESEARLHELVNRSNRPRRSSDNESVMAELQLAEQIAALQGAEAQLREQLDKLVEQQQQLIRYKREVKKQAIK